MANLTNNIHYNKELINKFLNILKGLILGIKSDGIISKLEFAELKNWCDMLGQYKHIKPFPELISQLEDSFNRNYFSAEKVYDILWVIDNYIGLDRLNHYNPIACSLNQLKGLLHGILSDNKINISEIADLNNWLNNNTYLIGYYPYDEIYSILYSILIDHVATEDEVNMLKVYFSEFIDKEFSNQIDFKSIEKLKEEYTIEGLCTVNPEITFYESYFTFSGLFAKSNRNEIKELLEALGGKYQISINNKTNYLVIGNNNDSCWIYNCYGRKVELALIERRKGAKLALISENDFWNAVTSK